MPEGEIRPVGRMAVALRAMALLAVVVALYLGGSELLHWFHNLVTPLEASDARLAATVAVVGYILFMAVPFMPAIEVGLVLMVAGGVPGILIVYFSTVIALVLSFLVGRWVPTPVLARFFRGFGLHRAGRLIAETAGMTADERLAYLTRRAPPRWLPFLLRHRYLAIAVALNTPGNALIGGGGGIGMVAGLSGVFPWPRYLALIMLAILPVPVVLLAGHAF